MKRAFKNNLGGGSYTNLFFLFSYWGFGVVVNSPNRRSRAVAPDVIALTGFYPSTSLYSCFSPKIEFL